MQVGKKCGNILDRKRGTYERTEHTFEKAKT